MRARRSSPLQGLNRRQNLVEIRHGPQLVNLRPGDFALRIHDEDRAVVDEGERVLVRWKYAVLCCRLGVRPAIGGERELETAQGFLIGDVREDRVGVDAHDLGVRIGELSQPLLSLRQLVVSNRREVERVKQNDDRLAAMRREVKLRLIFARRRVQLEIRRRISNY